MARSDRNGMLVALAVCLLLAYAKLNETEEDEIYKNMVADSIAWGVPIPPKRPPSDDYEAIKNYFSRLFLIQEAKLLKLGCKPIKQVFKIETLLKENLILKDELQHIIEPNQKVVLNRCLDKESYCPISGNKCSPQIISQKKIAINVYNSSLGYNYPIFRYVDIHEKCICQSMKKKELQRKQKIAINVYNFSLGYTNPVIEMCLSIKYKKDVLCYSIKIYIFKEY